MLDNKIAAGANGRASGEGVREWAMFPRAVREESRESATAFVIDAVEATGAASRQDFDIGAIVTVSHVIAECWDFSSMEQEIFWRIASQFMKD